jgi:carbon storage regulator
MLVLSRKPQQKICIGNDIYVTVLRIDRGRVKLGIEAPADVQVDRGEVRQPAVHASGV